jgi:hypothetical protein
MKPGTAQHVIDRWACGLLLAAGVTPTARSPWGQQTVEVLRDTYAEFGDRGLTVKALCDDMAERMPSIAAAGETPIVRALGNRVGQQVIQKTIEAAVMASLPLTDSTAGWTRTVPIENYMPNRRPILKAPKGLARNPRGKTAAAEAPEIVREESYRIKSYAKQGLLDEQDLIDDDVYAIVEFARRSGEAVQRLKLDCAYAVLLRNAALADPVALFHASHGNIIASSSLAEDKLDAAIAAIEKEMDESDADAKVLLDQRAGNVLVPSALRGKALRLVRNMEIQGGGNVTVDSDARLDNGVTDPIDGTVIAGSATSWYISARDRPAVEIGMLTPQPKVRTWIADAGEWGVGWDISWDIAAKALSFHGMKRCEA